MKTAHSINQRPVERKKERNELRKTVNENGLSALYRKAKNTHKKRQNRILDDIYDTFEYWIYEEACEACGLCG